MSTVILVGGNDIIAPTHFGERLCREVGMRQSTPSILSCNFAKEDPVDRQESEKSWLEWFQKFFPDSNVVVAEEHNWKRQVEGASMVYLHGGRTSTLIEVMQKLETTRKMFEGKLVIGSSAGANYLANGGFSPGADDYTQGIGLANVSILVHYGSKEKASLRHWSEIRSSIAEKFGQPVICISEGEFVVIET